MRPEDSLTPSELRTLRDRTSLSQAKFADRLAIRSNSVARMERGEMSIRPSLARLVLYVVAEWAEQPVEQLRAALEAQRTMTRPKNTKKHVESGRKRAGTRKR